MWDPSDHPHRDFAIDACMGMTILRRVADTPVIPVMTYLQDLTKTVREHLPDTLLPEPSDPELDWLAGQQAAKAQIELGVERVLLTIIAKSARDRQQMVVELAQDLYPEMGGPQPVPTARPSLS